MPSSTAIQQFVNDMRDRKSTIARAFDKVYKHCKDNPGDPFKATLANNLRTWNMTAGGLPSLSPAGVTLSDADKKHIGDWEATDRDKVRNAMVRALEDGNWDIVFWWDLDDDDLTEDAESKTFIEPPAAGNTLPDPPATDLGVPGGLITVTFLTPRKKVKKAFSLNLTVGGIGLEV
jgi:hypothetical protein